MYDVNLGFLFVNSFIFQPFVEHFKGRIRDEIQKRVSASLQLHRMC